MTSRKLSPPALGRTLAPNVWDVVALVLVIGTLVLMAVRTRRRIM